MRKIFLCVILISLLAALPSFGIDWLHRGGNVFHTRLSTEVMGTQLGIDWSSSVVSEAGGFLSSPAVANGFIYAGGMDGTMYAIDADDGSVVWSQTTGGAIVSSPLYCAGNLYFNSLDGFLYCLDADTGVIQQQVQTFGSEYNSPVVVGSTLVYCAGFPLQEVVVLDKTNFQVQAKFSLLDQVVNQSVAIDGSSGYVADNSGKLYKFSLTTNDTLIWSYEGSGFAGMTSPVLLKASDQVVYNTGGTEATMFCVNATTGVEEWQTEFVDPNPVPVGTTLATQAGPSSPSTDSNFLYSTVRFTHYIDEDTSGDGVVDLYWMNEYVFCVDRVTGNIVWTVENGMNVVSFQSDVPPLGLCPTPSIHMTGSAAVLAVQSSVEGQLRILSTIDGSELSSVALDAGGVSSPAPANARLVTATSNGSVYSISTELNDPPSTPVSGFSPAQDANLATSPSAFSWDAATDDATPSQDLVYTFTLGETEFPWRNPLFSTTLAAGVTTVDPGLTLNEDQYYYYSVRVQDGLGAYSSQSDVIQFGVLVAPDEPQNMTASRGDGLADIAWLAEPEMNYDLFFGPDGGALDGPVDAGTTGQFTITGLTNNVLYRIELYSRDAQGNISNTPASATVTPNPDIVIGSNFYPDLNAAANAAGANDTISVSSGTYSLSSTLRLRSGVTLSGESPATTIINGNGFSIHAEAGANGDAGLDNVRVDTTTDAIVVETNAGMTLTNVLITGSALGAGVRNEGSVVIRYTTISGRSQQALLNLNGMADIQDSIVANNGTGLSTQGGVVVSDFNCVADNAANYANTAIGAHDFEGVVTFNNNFTVSGDSENIDMANVGSAFQLEPAPNGGRGNVGAYGNTALAAAGHALAVVEPLVLPSGEIDAAYFHQLIALGGQAPYDWTLQANLLPDGMVLNADGSVTGLVNDPILAGVYFFTVQVVDDLGQIATADMSLTMNVASESGFHITTHSIPTILSGMPFNMMIGVTNAVGNLAYALTGGALPAGLSLDIATGMVTGVPLFLEGEQQFTVQITATDDDNNSSSKNYTFTVEGEAVEEAGPGGGGGGGGNVFSGGGGGGGAFDLTTLFFLLLLAAFGFGRMKSLRCSHRS